MRALFFASALLLLVLTASSSLAVVDVDVNPWGGIARCDVPRTLQVRVAAHDNEMIRGFEVKVTVDSTMYDPDGGSPFGIAVGDFLTGYGRPYTFAVARVGTGTTYSVAGAILGNPCCPIPWYKTLFTITAVPRSEGTTSIVLSDVKVRGPNNELLGLGTVTNGMLNIDCTPPCVATVTEYYLDGPCLTHRPALRVTGTETPSFGSVRHLEYQYRYPGDPPGCTTNDADWRPLTLLDPPSRPCLPTETGPSGPFTLTLTRPPAR